MRSLRCENELLHWRITAYWAAQENRSAGLQGYEPAEVLGPRDVREQTDVREDQLPLGQDAGETEVGWATDNRSPRRMSMACYSHSPSTEQETVT